MRIVVVTIAIRTVGEVGRRGYLCRRNTADRDKRYCDDERWNAMRDL